VWALGPESCFEGINQTGGACPTNGHSGGAGDWGAAEPFNQRLLDPVASAGCTNATLAPETAQRMHEAWRHAEAARAAGVWDASAAWSE
jgi:hypothetical protein